MTDLTAAEALRRRLASLMLVSPGDSVAGIVEWFGAMQAQDLASGMWSLGLRLPGSTVADVQAALERREALRTWPMRGTVHLVPPRDARWMLALTGERTLAGVAARRESLGLTEAMADRGVEVLSAALSGGRRLTRAECLRSLTDAGVTTTGQIGYHMLWYASQRGVTCIAPNVGKEQTFVLLAEWAPDQAAPSREEALGILTVYFRSHGPATRQDLGRWAGLTMAEVRQGVAAAGDALATVRVDGAEMVAAAAQLDAPPPSPPGVLVLPGFDEYLLGYRDRSLMLDDQHKQAVIPGGNGVFQSTVVRAGRVAATWKRTLTRKTVTVQVRPFGPVTAAERAQVAVAFEPYAAYLGLQLRLRWP